MSQTFFFPNFRHFVFVGSGWKLVGMFIGSISPDVFFIFSKIQFFFEKSAIFWKFGLRKIRLQWPHSDLPLSVFSFCLISMQLDKHCYWVNISIKFLEYFEIPNKIEKNSILRNFGLRIIRVVWAHGRRSFSGLSSSWIRMKLGTYICLVDITVEF